MKSIDTRTVGKAIYTTVVELPKRFTYGPHTEMMARYLGRRWRAEEHGWWKRVKAVAYNPKFAPAVAKMEEWRFVENPADGMRLVGRVDEITTEGIRGQGYIHAPLVDHRGWYTDSYYSGKCWGEVWQLPSRGGDTVYVPAYRADDEYDGGRCMNFDDATSDLRDAIHAADRMAEMVAEEMREAEELDREEQRREEIKEEIQEIYAAFKTLSREVRGNCEKLSGLPAVRRLIGEEWRRVKAEIVKLRMEERKLEG